MSLKFKADKFFMRLNIPLGITIYAARGAKREEQIKGTVCPGAQDIYIYIYRVHKYIKLHV